MYYGISIQPPGTADIPGLFTQRQLNIIFRQCINATLIGAYFAPYLPEPI